MITLKGSQYKVSYDDNSGEHHVFVRNKDGYKEITNIMTNEDKDELINDLIYCITDLLKKWYIKLWFN